MQTSCEHMHKPSAPPPPTALVCLDQSHITFRQRDISVFTEKVKAAWDLRSKQGLRSCMFLKSDSPDLKSTGFVIWGKKNHLTSVNLLSAKQEKNSA